MQETMTLKALQGAQGEAVYASDGGKIGSVEEIFVDEETGKPEWIGLGTGFLGTKRVLAPVVGADLREDGVYLPYTKEQVKGTPDVDAEEIIQETAAALYAHYGLPYSERRSDTGLPEGAPAPRVRGGEAELVRAEEELRVGKRETEAGRARLRKWVETEPVQAEVELRRERVRVEREPVNQPVSGAEIGEDEIEVAVRAEEAVVGKETVAKERVSLEKEVDVERETVADELRKERVEVEGEDVSR